MNYDFTLDKKGIISVLGSSFLLGALLFVAGLIVGSYWTANGPTVAAAAKKSPGADKDLSTQPQSPVLLNDVGQSNVVVANKPAAGVDSGTLGPAALTPPPTAGLPPAAQSQQSDAAAADDGSAAKPETKAASDPASPDPNSAAAAPPSPAVNESDLVTVEVGTFLDANAANRLFKSLERKGYAPTFFTGRDAQSREWYSIRVGAYSDKQQAENAAANFTKQEKIKAVVRPLGSL